MRPPFAYYGGKTRIAPRIAALLPKHRHYVEPFAGGLSVLLAKRPSPVETVNDLDGDLMNFWRVLRDRPDDLARACTLTPHSRAEHQAAYEPVTDEVEQARRLWVLLSQGRNAITTRTGWRMSPQTTAVGNTLLGYAGRMGDLAERLSRVGLECRPAMEVIATYGVHADTCLYVDPPYLAEVRARTGYRCEMPTREQHGELLESLLGCRAAVVLSGYASDFYAERLDGWHAVDIRAVTAQGGDSRGRTEVLWSNRPLDLSAAVRPAEPLAAGVIVSDEVTVAAGDVTAADGLAPLGGMGRVVAGIHEPILTRELR